MDPRHALGRQGEARAAAYLVSRGYRIVARNVRSGGVELDLIAVHGATVIFVEVKTRRGGAAGAPHDAVDLRKRQRIVRGATAWLRAQRLRSRRVRFDVVSITAVGKRFDLRHFEGAFDASRDG